MLLEVMGRVHVRGECSKPVASLSICCAPGTDASRVDVQNAGVSFGQKETRERLPATWHALACSRCAPDHHMIGITNLKTAFEFYEWIVSKGTLVFPMIGIGRHARRYQAARRRA